MTMSALFAAMRKNLLGSVWGPLVRGAWCRKQRRHLSVPGHSVVWVRGDAVPWAEWGARHGYFEVDLMDGLSYLRALGAPVV
ncbi:MAG TPA: hypothetical protein VMK12_26515 [Anaeromyxobacteraceae bacterium]|nr:hypothetical protein [Anaeromyxobacteraceae bacterium]